MIFILHCIEQSVDAKALFQNLVSFLHRDHGGCDKKQVAYLCLCKAFSYLKADVYVGSSEAQYVLEHIPNVASEVNITEGRESVMFVKCADYNHAERAKKHNTLL